jgi:hypothetical protein
MVVSLANHASEMAAQLGQIAENISDGELSAANSVAIAKDAIDVAREQVAIIFDGAPETASTIAGLCSVADGHVGEVGLAFLRVVESLREAGAIMAEVEAGPATAANNALQVAIDEADSVASTLPI